MVARLLFLHSFLHKYHILNLFHVLFIPREILQAAYHEIDYFKCEILILEKELNI